MGIPRIQDMYWVLGSSNSEQDPGYRLVFILFYWVSVDFAGNLERGHHVEDAGDSFGPRNPHVDTAPCGNRSNAQHVRIKTKRGQKRRNATTKKKLLR